ncbi:pyrophosphate--fructose-6-phosphate 1-phosphotransferase [Arcanobacterium wilhelmae]|uniref:Pyrophosphate--fructose 6-phosphate 1-phosphotransferase n=1 Tax=Arcanobacterium wilhelmae TaxID=1803177 RepID=A0ABT9N9I1_9ACTO|nr:pyrophosphate--fructose-6-phosphate 1-phosphotransferase [Arcanobacterium wilhelmae]MDP9800175.1 pyrophosphate--fructose-6-phosphate 1-phosphotransferase [Arcanobacterium wilhelmae]
MSVRRVALLTAGGFAPCLSTAIGDLVEIYTREAPEVEIIAYQYGYYGLLKGQYVVFGDEVRKNAEVLTRFGGSPIGNSRVKLTNVQDCIDRGLVKEGELPLEVAAKQLQKDGVDVLHTIGGDDTNTAAADLAAYLKENNYDLTVVGLPKTIDNDIVPIKQSLGAWTAADEASKFAQNIIGEHRSNPRMLIIHEIMGRNCGYLAAQATANYHQWVKEQQWLPEAGLSAERSDVHALYLPEIGFDLDVEASRLRKIMDEQGNVNIFLSEGAGVAEIIEEMVEDGEEPERDAFGHVKLDTINPGQWFAKKFSQQIGAEKVMVQKSGYFSRSAASNEADLKLIREVAELAVKAAFARTPGVVGQDEENNDELSVIAFPRIAGHKPFNTNQEWFGELMGEIGQAWSAK